MPALFFAGEEPARDELCQMRARGLRGDVRGKGEVAGVERTPSISAESMFARAGSPTNAAISAM